MGFGWAVADVTMWGWCFGLRYLSGTDIVQMMLFDAVLSLLILA